PNSGAVITRVQEHGPAAKGGLVVGDIVTSIAGQAVKDSRDVQKIVTALPLDQPTEVIILRDGKVMVAKVTVEQMPDAPPAPAGAIPFQNLGLAVSDLSPELCNRLGYPANTKGAVIVVVTRNGVADLAGLRSGQVIVKVDKTPVTSAASFQQAIGQADKEKGAMRHVLRPAGEVGFAVLKLNESWGGGGGGRAVMLQHKVAW